MSAGPLGDSTEGEQTVVPAANTAAGLVERIRAGDRLAEEELVVTYQRALFAIAAARTRDREMARDLVQEVLIAVLKALREGQLRDPSKLAGFIQGTTRNIVNNYFRKQQNRVEVELTTDELPGSDPVADMEAAERHHLVGLELQSFNVTDQQILLLSMVDGHSLAEVARRVNLSHDAVRARKSRMLRKIVKKFASLSQK